MEGAPVINGIPIALKMAELAVKLPPDVSRAGEFVQPPGEFIEGIHEPPKGL